MSQLRLHLGDPRIDAEHRWDGAKERTRQTVRSWLSKLSLDAFFDVVGRFAGSDGMDHQWKARKAFWGACLREGHISDSWLVLGDSVVRSIADNRELRGSYGRLNNNNPSQSVLLLRIGDLVFSEWTHNGKLRAWEYDWKKAPRLFSPRYDRSEVVGAGLQFPAPLHRPNLRMTSSDGASHVSGWQGRVAALLRKKHGIALPASIWNV